MAVPQSVSRDLAQIAIFAALIAALGIPGAFYLAGNAVPITLQTLGVMLAGAILGARKGTLAVAVVLVLVLCGVPLLSSRATGSVALFSGPTSGYLWGWLLGVWVIGLLTQRLLPRYPIVLGFLATVLGGVLVIYLVGTAWLIVRVGLPVWTAVSANFVYLPGDLLKAVVATVVAQQVHRAYPGLISSARPRTRSATN